MKTKLLFLLLFVGPLLLAGEKKDRPAKVDINTASVAELEQLPAIGPRRAEMIVRIRERNGPFRSVEELRALPRLSETQFQRLKKHVTVGKPENPSSQSEKPHPR